jgi:predicted 3-demethylubiquinone-9 3-methyltransferase (glyoxalase superfamily)
MKTRIYPCLWFDTQAEEAAKFYTSIFPNSKIKTVTHYGDGMPMPKGTVMVVHFTIDGHEVMALNGGPLFQFSEAISMVLSCETQKEIDHYWDKLTAGGGKVVQCGWLKDRFGLSWQVVPNVMDTMMDDKDPARSARVMSAVMKSVKFDIKQLQKAYEGEGAVA